VAGHFNGFTMIWEHVGGDCGFATDSEEPIDPADWRMEFRLGTCEAPVHWNCDCCFNTVADPDPPPGMPRILPARQAYFTAVITAKTDTCQSDGGP